MFTESWRYLVKNPPPAMKLSGEWSLKRSISPGCRALNDPSDDGRQKFTSSTSLDDVRKVNQSLSVTATNMRISLWEKYSAGYPLIVFFEKGMENHKSKLTQDQLIAKS
jgi:hypothetical protein